MRVSRGVTRGKFQKEPGDRSRRRPNGSWNRTPVCRGSSPIGEPCPQKVAGYAEKEL